jgi:hypothetical protein
MVEPKYLLLVVFASDGDGSVVCLYVRFLTSRMSSMSASRCAYVSYLSWGRTLTTIVNFYLSFSLSRVSLGFIPDLSIIRTSLNPRHTYSHKMVKDNGIISAWWIEKHQKKRTCYSVWKTSRPSKDHSHSCSPQTHCNPTNCPDTSTPVLRPPFSTCQSQRSLLPLLPSFVVFSVQATHSGGISSSAARLSFRIRRCLPPAHYRLIYCQYSWMAGWTLTQEYFPLQTATGSKASSSWSLVGRLPSSLVLVSCCWSTHFPGIEDLPFSD